MDIPTHHMKQEVCNTRKPYREGRHPKAVKVYTVNNESVYLIIQGVPSVGAGGELTKLCASFGSVEECRALDEYPCEDKYTEVYLVKYKKIQSSRFAKRKLDDHSFFGGNLHVCYAPEYESVQETRDKLQNRRQVIAKKIRQHCKLSCTNEKAQLELQRKPDTIQPKSNTEKTNVEINETSLHPEYSELPLLDQQRSQSQYHMTFPVDNVPAPHICNTVNQFAEQTVHTQDPLRPETDDNSELNVFQLPLPPKSIEKSQQVKANPNWKQYEYSKVPTAHATLPEGYDGRLDKNQQSALSQSSPIIVKDYKRPKPALKFVPRQAVKPTSRQHPTTGTKTADLAGSVDDELRKNAFHLGKVQGPKEMPGEKRPLPTAAQRSVNDTISSIRSKISKVIGEKIGKNS